MASRKSKLDEVKDMNPDLYLLVIDKKLSITDAYNEAKRLRYGLKEYRGSGTKKKLFATDFKRIIELHKPSQDELIEEIKKAFPLTWNTFIKLS